MFKFLGNAIYKTPWWAMLLGGLFVLLLLALFTVPTNVIKLTDANANAAERRAVQREVDLAMKDSALGLAERVVTSMVERTSDAGRRAELEQALRDIAEARKEMAVVAGDAERAIADATGEATREAKRMAKEAATNARERAREAAVQARDAARERLQELRNAKQEARTLQERVGVKDESTLASFDKAIAEAEASVKQAEAAISELKKSLPIFIGIGPGQTTATESIASKKSDEALNFDLGAGEKRIKGSISQTPSGTPVITLDATAAIPPPAPPSAPDAASPPSPPLPPELRDDIRRKVTSDFKRVGIGSALILAFFPLFFLLLVVKYYIGRSRRAQDVAAQKTQEAESANVNRQIVEAKLMALQAQVEPHFLYNTLANVQALTEVDPAQANQMTGHLIQYLRASL
ncbi:MAG: histidine kinase, partial [Burkholderiales bacterium]